MLNVFAPFAEASAENTKEFIIRNSNKTIKKWFITKMRT